MDRTNELLVKMCGIKYKSESLQSFILMNVCCDFQDVNDTASLLPLMMMTTTCLHVYSSFARSCGA